MKTVLSRDLALVTVNRAATGGAEPQLRVLSCGGACRQESVAERFPAQASNYWPVYDYWKPMRFVGPAERKRDRQHPDADPERENLHSNG